MERRYASLIANTEDNEKYSIIAGDLNIEKDTLDIFFKSPNKLEISLRMMNEADVNMRQFGIRQVRNYTDTLKRNAKIDQVFKKIYYDDILNILFTSEDYKEIFETSWIIINLSLCSSEVIKYLTKEENIRQLFVKMTKIGDNQILNHFLWIFANVIGDRQESYQQVVSKVDIVPYVCNLVKASNLPLFLKSTCFWVLGNLGMYMEGTTVPPMVESVANEIIKYLRSQINKEIYSEALSALAKIVKSSNNEEFIEYVIKQDIHTLLFNMISHSTDCYDLKNIFSLLGNFSYASDDFIKELSDNDGFKYLENFLAEALTNIRKSPSYLKHNACLIKDFCWTLANICGGGDEKIKGKLIRRTEITSLLLELYYMTTNNEIKKEILYYFCSAIDSRNSNIKTEVLRLKVLECFYGEMTGMNGNEIVLLSLNGIIFFLQFGETIMKSRNIVKEELEKKGIFQYIDDLQNSRESKIVEKSTFILNKYAKNDSNI